MSDALTRLRALLEQARALYGKLPFAGRVLAATTALALAALLAYFSFRSALEPYVPLYNQLDREDAAAITAKLKELKVPYRLTEGGATVEVPEARVYETRLELASAGLPHGGAVGFETFDKMRLGATEFEQRAMYRRALEGELVRTISTIAAVQSARVHLVLPDKSIFLSRSEPASASVVVKLRPGKQLGPNEVGGVVHLVAASVPNLAPERVALVTADGQMLHKPRKSEATQTPGMDEDALSEKQAAESAMEDRVRAMLERLVGAGHADVRVSTEIDLARVEHVEDHYDPKSSALRSSDETTERVAQESSVAGVPGSESNTPQGAAPGGGPAGSNNLLRESKTHNFEIDHVSDKRVQSAGATKRVTVAVILDGVSEGGKMVPRSKAELDRLAALVTSAVGADPKRGDVVTVDSIPFVLEPEPAAVPAPSPISIDTLVKNKRALAIAGGAAALFVVAAAALLVRGRKKKKQLAQIKAQQRAVAISAEGAKTVLEAEEIPRVIDWRADAIALAARDPATAALVVRAWLGAHEEGSKTEAMT